MINHAINYRGLTHECNTPDCHVPGFVTTLAMKDEDRAFIGSGALLTALLDTYTEHIGIPETDGPDGPYMGCACGWRSDDFSTVNPGLSYAIHLTNAQHAAAVVALQPRVERVIRPATSGGGDDA